MAPVVGYDHHPASRAALSFAGDLAGALNVPLHVVHVVDMSDNALDATAGAAAGEGDPERRHVAAALDGTQLQWTYHRMGGQPVAALLQAASELGAEMIVVGRPEQGTGAAFGHIVTGAVARRLIRRSRRPVVVVPEDVDGLRWAAAQTACIWVEPLAALAARAHTAFLELVAEDGPGPIAIVSHDAFNGALLAQFDPGLTGVRQRTACWNQLSRVDGAWRVDAYDLKPD